MFYTYSSEDLRIDASRLEPTSTIDGDATQGNAAGELSAALAPPVSPTTWVKSGIGYSLSYSDVDNFRDPRQGVLLNLRQDFFGAGGDATPYPY
ncbi:MAG: hypothetical protein R3D29_04730 [Nitratireductor sp.]